MIVPESQVAWRSASAAARHVPQIFSTAGEALKLLVLWVSWKDLTRQLSSPKTRIQDEGHQIFEAGSIFNMAMRKLLESFEPARREFGAPITSCKEADLDLEIELDMSNGTSCAQHGIIAYETNKCFL